VKPSIEAVAKTTEVQSKLIEKSKSKQVQVPPAKCTGGCSRVPAGAAAAAAFHLRHKAMARSGSADLHDADPASAVSTSRMHYDATLCACGLFDFQEDSPAHADAAEYNRVGELLYGLDR
jgi:hypothetical protein